MINHANFIHVGPFQYKKSSILYKLPLKRLKLCDKFWLALCRNIPGFGLMQAPCRVSALLPFWNKDIWEKNMLVRDILDTLLVLSFNCLYLLQNDLNWMCSLKLLFGSILRSKSQAHMLLRSYLRIRFLCMRFRI